MTAGDKGAARKPLKELLESGAGAEALRDKARSLRAVNLSARSLSDLELLAIGGYSPLDGFMTRADYLGVVNDMHMADGEAWSMPITLAVSEDKAASIKEGEEVALGDESGHAMAVLEVREKFPYDKSLEARQVSRTEDEAHPVSLRSMHRATSFSAAPCTHSKSRRTATSAITG
jgi:sulfate adenylyltransferase